MLKVSHRRRWSQRSTRHANKPTYPQRYACSYSTGSAHKKWGPPRGNGSPNKRRQLRGMGGADGLNPSNSGLRFAFPA
jgi:hypothetical protein